MPRRNAAFDSRDRRLVELMVVGHTQQQCADVLGMHRTTVQRRAQRPGFQRELAVAEGEVRRTARRKIAASLTAAADVLVRHAQDDELPPMVRVAAAGRLLSTWAALEPRQLDAHVALAAPPPVASESWADVIDAYAAKVATAYGTVGGEEIHPNGDKETA